MYAIFIDTFQRELGVYAVSVTETAKGLVLRKAATLEDFPLREVPLMIVRAEGYEARSSAGFVSVHPGEGAVRAQVIGLCGFPWIGGLRAIAPMSVVVVGDAMVKDIDTHKNLNTATAEAAKELLPLCTRGTLLMQGQSNYVEAFEISGSLPDLSDIPKEHRDAPGDIFSPVGISKVIFGKEIRRRKIEYEGEKFPFEGVLLTAALARAAWYDGKIYNSSWGAFDLNVIRPDEALDIVKDYVENGWKISIYHGHIAAHDESGMEVLGFDLHKVKKEDWFRVFFLRLKKILADFGEDEDGDLEEQFSSYLSS